MVRSSIPENLDAVCSLFYWYKHYRLCLLGETKGFSTSLLSAPTTQTRCHVKVDID